MSLENCHFIVGDTVVIDDPNCCGVVAPRGSIGSIEKINGPHAILVYCAHHDMFHDCCFACLSFYEKPSDAVTETKEEKEKKNREAGIALQKQYYEKVEGGMHRLDLNKRKPALTCHRRSIKENCLQEACSLWSPELKVCSDRGSEIYLSRIAADLAAIINQKW